MRRTKLTLSIEKSLVANAKRLASREGTSLSSMISRYLAALLQPRLPVVSPAEFLKTHALG